MFDYHLHTRLCRHASGTIEEYVETALSRGLEEICFTPHIPLPCLPVMSGNLRMDAADIDLYFIGVERVKNRYKELKILTGIEADYLEGCEEFLESFLSRYSFDLVLMSIHFIRDWPDGQWVFNFDFPDKSMAEIYGEYFQAIKKGIKTGLFDNVAHLDLIKQPGYPVLDKNREDVEEIIDLCLERDMSMEINTSGRRKEIGEYYPSHDIIRVMIEKGVHLTVGSDAHEPAHVGLFFEDIEELLEGFSHSRLVRYSGRKPAALLYR